jgi:hypothetical protein
MTVTETAPESPAMTLALEPLHAPALPAPVTDFGPVRLELMGHRYRQGNLSETVIAGQPFLRLDLDGGGVEYYRPDAVYCITPATVAVPRGQVAQRFGDLIEDAYEGDYGNEDDDDEC